MLVGGYAGTWLTPNRGSAPPWTGRGWPPSAGSSGAPPWSFCRCRRVGIHETAAVMRWLAEQTAGQCGPCVHGLTAIADATEGLRLGRVEGDVLARLTRWAGDVEGRGACRYPDGAVRFMRSALTTFATDAHAHGLGRRCAGAARPTVLPLPDIRRAA